MGIPSHKFIKPKKPPNGYQLKNSGVVDSGDLVWSASEGSFIVTDEFPNTIGEDVAHFFGVATKT